MSLIQRTIQISFQQRVYFTRGVFALHNALLANVLLDNQSNQAPKALFVLHESLHAAQPKLARSIEDYFATRREQLSLGCARITLEGRERGKNSYVHNSEIQSHIDR